MSARRLVLAAAAVLLSTACGATTAGVPIPNPAAAASTTARALPPRPRQLDLTKVDPCRDVLTRDQLHELAYDLGYQRRPIPGNSAIDDVNLCGYSSESPPDQPKRSMRSLIGISLSAGADVWLTDPNRRTAATRQVLVAGFPAVVRPNPSFVDNCEVLVDVHDRQYLSVSSGATGGVHGTSPDPYCAEAQRVAGMVIQNLSIGR